MSVFLTLAVLAAACADETSPPESPDSATPASTAGREDVLPALTAEQETGAQVWETVCWTCHGEAARADGPAVVSGAVGAAPPNLNQEEFALMTAQDWEERFEAVFMGTDSTHPHMKNVAAFLNRESFDAALAYLPELLSPPDLPGSARVGAREYAFRCGPCHGVDGRGHGPAAEDLIISPVDLTTDTLIARGDHQALYEKIKKGGMGIHGSSMPAWGVMFSDPEIWDLVAYILNFQG